MARLTQTRQEQEQSQIFSACESSRVKYVILMFFRECVCVRTSQDQTENQVLSLNNG